MLGAVNTGGHWAWAAFGKHPVAADYIHAGSDAPILAALSNWMSSGQQALTSSKKECPRPYSWRFWAGGVRKHHVLCGLLRASSDRIGRCYPLMIVGTGEMKSWEKGWDLLPLLFEGLWRRMESISSRSYTAFDAFREDLRHLGKPPSDWHDMRRRQEGFRSHERWAAAADAMQQQAAAAMRSPESLFPMDSSYFDDPLLRIGFWHYMLCRQERRPPKAVFIGGVSERLYLSVLNRPIVREDYIRICTIDDAEEIPRGM